MNRFFLVVVLLGVCAGVGVAQTAPNPQTTPAPLPDERTLTITDAPGTGGEAVSTPSADVSVWDFLRMFLILALVIGMILGFLWFLKKLSQPDRGIASPIRVLHTQPLGGNRVLQVVEVGQEVLLLGTGDGGLSLIKDLSGSETADTFRMAAAQGPAAGGKKSFSDLLGTMMGVRPKIRPDLGEPGENSSDFLKKQRERLKNLGSSSRT